MTARELFGNPGRQVPQQLSSLEIGCGGVAMLLGTWHQPTLLLPAGEQVPQADEGAIRIPLLPAGEKVPQADEGAKELSR